MSILSRNLNIGATISKAAIIAAAIASICIIERHYAANGINLYASELLKYIAFGAVFILPQGYFFIRCACSIYPDGITPSEKLTITLTTGYSVTCLIAYLCVTHGLGALYGWASIFAFIVFVVIVRPVSRIRYYWKSFSPLPVFIILLAAVRFLYVYCYFTVDKGALYYRQFLTDNQFVISIIHEMSRGVPMRQLPILAGIPFPRYHFMGAFLVWLTNRYAGVETLNAFHVYTPVAFTILVSSHTYFACKRATGNAYYGCAGLILSLFLYFPIHEISVLRFRPPVLNEMEFMYFSFTSLSALPFVAGFAHLFMLKENRISGRMTLILPGFFAGAVCMFKMNFFLSLFPAYISYLIFTGITKREEAVKCFCSGLAGIAAAAVCLLPIILYKSYASIILHYGLMSGRFFSEFVTPTSELTQFLSSINPSVIKDVLPCVLALFAPFLQVGLIPSILLLTFAITPRAMATRFRLFCLFAYIYTVFIYLFVIDPKLPINIALFLPALLVSFSFAPVTIGMKAIVETLSNRISSITGKAIPKYVLTLTLAVSATLSIHDTFDKKYAYKTKLDRAEVDAMNFLRNNTPRDAVVMTNHTNLALIPMLAARRAFVSYNTSTPYYASEYSRRLADVDMFYNTTSCVSAKDILTKNNISYVMSFENKPLNLMCDNVVTPVYIRNGVTIWKAVSGHKAIDSR